MAWRPALEGGEAQRALEAALSIARSLEARPAQASERQPLAEALSERALLQAHLDAVRPGEGHGEAALQALDDSIDAVLSTNLSPALHGGFLGVAFIAHQLSLQLGAEVDLDAIDEALLAHLDAPGPPPPHEVMIGLAGFAAYALERLPSRAASACLERISALLEESAREEPAGLAWFTDAALFDDDELRERNPRGHYNVGFAHGTPGVIAALAAMQLAGAGGARVSKLLGGAVRWLFAQRLGAEVPWYVGPGIAPEPARAAWCYGAPAVAWALLRAARAAGDASWEREARAMALSAAARPIERCGVRDACLCHGAAGLGHLYGRLFQITGEPALREAARDWVLRALELDERGAAPAGGSAALVEDPSFLTGAIGVALALVAAATDREPAWDGRLLISRPW
jgi:hypothetical protein